MKRDQSDQEISPGYPSAVPVITLMSGMSTYSLESSQKLYRFLMLLEKHARCLANADFDNTKLFALKIVLMSSFKLPHWSRISNIP